jgi:hypothetical protein
MGCRQVVCLLVPCVVRLRSTSMTTLRASTDGLPPGASPEYLANIAKTVSICRGLEAAYARAKPPVDDRLLLSNSNYSRKLREAIMFTSCGSYTASRIEIPVKQNHGADAARRKFTRSNAYIDRFVDGWTVDGVPSLWFANSWRKHPPTQYAPRAATPQSPQRDPKRLTQTCTSATGSVLRSASRLSRPATPLSH